MSSTVLKRALVFASFAFVSSAVLGKEAQSTLSCDNQKVERTALKQAPMGARRVNRHVLEIMSNRGAQRFIDNPPREGMGGVHWRYCGYDARAKAHLIAMVDGNAYSGDLLLESTDKLAHAGHTVVFSRDRKAFLAIHREAGVDGEHWAVRDAAGKTIWEGYAGTLAKVDGVETVVSTFERPRWNRRGQLTSRFVCASSKVRGVVTLARLSAGDWRWRFSRACQEQKRTLSAASLAS
jgi:hypothetical protein